MSSSSPTRGRPADGDLRSGGVRIYWHRELPPLSAEMVGDHIVEATSGCVPGTLAHRDELWDQCYEDLMARARDRIEQEVLRLGGCCAHILNETVESHHNNARNEAWLRGRFTYALYRENMGALGPCPPKKEART